MEFRFERLSMFCIGFGVGICNYRPGVGLLFLFAGILASFADMYFSPKGR